MPSRLIVFLLIALNAAGWLTHRAHGADASQPRKIRTAFTSLSSVMCPPWIAREAGIFNKHGLDVEVIAEPRKSSRIPLSARCSRRGFVEALYR